MVMLKRNFPDFLFRLLPFSNSTAPDSARAKASRQKSGSKAKRVSFCNILRLVTQGLVLNYSCHKKYLVMFFFLNTFQFVFIFLFEVVLFCFGVCFVLLLSLGVLKLYNFTVNLISLVSVFREKPVLTSEP
mmetsp:Transcript_8573/g.9757  ORF Transcript_8573/g.9757 Transcript_8573/m.9757 type:complete len:131 (-) Transcript_8573:200-592(-)